MVLPGPDFWEPAGRLGVISYGDWSNRLVLVYPDAPGIWAFIVSSNAGEGDMDFYPQSDKAADEVIDELGIIWLARSIEEERLEDRVFGLRRRFFEDNSIRGMLRGAMRKLLGKLGDPSTGNCSPTS